MSARTRLQDVAQDFTQSSVNAADLVEALKDASADNVMAQRLHRGATNAAAGGAKTVSVNCFALRSALGVKGTVETADVLHHFDRLLRKDPKMVMKDAAEFLYSHAQSWQLDMMPVTADELKKCGVVTPAATPAAATK